MGDAVHEGHAQPIDKTVDHPRGDQLPAKGVAVQDGVETRRDVGRKRADEEPAGGGLVGDVGLEDPRRQPPFDPGQDDRQLRAGQARSGVTACLHLGPVGQDIDVMVEHAFLHQVQQDQFEPGLAPSRQQLGMGESLALTANPSKDAPACPRR